MPVPTWTLEERRILVYVRIMYDQTESEVHDLMSRIFGEDWRDVRKKYSYKDIRDEFSSRWKIGKRSPHYRIVDPESGQFDANGTQERQRADQRILAAAAQTSGPNWLRESATGVLSVPNAIIVLRHPQIAYVRPASTFDIAFAREKARKDAAKLTSSSAAAPTNGQTTRPNTSRRKIQTSSTIPAQSSSVNSAAVPSERARTKSRLQVRSHTRPAHPTHELLMIHCKDVEIEDRRLILRADKKIISINKSTKIYQHGGELVRVWDHSKDRHEDLVLCDADVCCTCRKSGKTSHLMLKFARSPTDGLPFVHLGRDTSINEVGENVFRPTGPAGIAELKIPDHEDTIRAVVLCKTGGDTKRVAVLGCIAKRCLECTPTAEKPEEDEQILEETDDYVVKETGELPSEDDSQSADEESSENSDESVLDDGEIEEDGDEYQPSKRQCR